jgi:hypothetical protein
MPLSSALELALSSQSATICPRCGPVPIGAMTKRGICYECCLRADGKSTLEGHHVFGRQRDTIVPIPGNFHRPLNRQRQARPHILKSPPTGPILEAAFLLTVVTELMAAGADYARSLAVPNWICELADPIAAECRRAADRQLSVHAYLVDTLGPNWHKSGSILS